MRLIVLLCLANCAAAPAAAQQVGFRTPIPAPPSASRFDPASEYITPGQDEPGYQAWYKSAAWRGVYVRAFNDYLIGYGVGGVVPTWQLLRTATDWRRCGADPFEVPPSTDWGNIVATLRYVREAIVPVIGPVEPVSVYRNPLLNACAGGAQASTHREMGAVDVVPLRAIRREELMVQLCALHAAHPDSNTGLGFYKGLRFHIDARKYREWGTRGAHGGIGCAAVLAEGAAPFGPYPAAADMPPPARITYAVPGRGASPARITIAPAPRITAPPVGITITPPPTVAPPAATPSAPRPAVSVDPLDPLDPLAPIAP